MADSVVELQELGPGIIQVRMQDRVNKNTFSPELIRDLNAAFKSINEAPDCKVVILTGYDSYFASGGTQQGLVALQEGQAKFTDVSHYTLPLYCNVPVISAMQGHGIGGGFIIGLFGDIVILGRESVYTTNFMKYGFTPGVGATYIVPKKCGVALAQEMLITARTYRGGELERRGVPFPVLPRADVLDYAKTLAQEISEKPRISLVTLKEHLVTEVRNELPGFLHREVEMHKATLHRREIKERIQTLFGR